MPRPLGRRRRLAQEMPADKPRLVARGAPSAVPMTEVARFATHGAVQFLDCWLSAHACAKPLSLEIARVSNDC